MMKAKRIPKPDSPSPKFRHIQISEKRRKKKSKKPDVSMMNMLTGKHNNSAALLTLSPAEKSGQKPSATEKSGQKPSATVVEADNGLTSKKKSGNESLSLGETPTEVKVPLSGKANGGNDTQKAKGKRRRKKRSNDEQNAVSPLDSSNKVVPNDKVVSSVEKTRNIKDKKQNNKRSSNGDDCRVLNSSSVQDGSGGVEKGTLVSNGKQKREKFQNSKRSSLREKMMSRLSAARFRYINEELYTWDGQESPSVFASDPRSFKAYHNGFQQQTKLWPINPIDVIIRSIKKMPHSAEKVVADFGCGEAKLSLELSSNKVFSFDLVALNDRVTVADNANCKLYSGSVDVAVHCLSLMSANISGYIKEANRVLKTGGILKIAEVESRFDDVDKFVANVSKFNFKLVKKDLSHNLFYFMDFEKIGDIGIARKRKLPALSLNPCLYKKR